MNPIIDPLQLREHYSCFRVKDRTLLTGHSHQAWPDLVQDAYRESFEDAAREVDHKWSRAFDQAQRVREGYRGLLDHLDGDITLAANTHELLVRFLSALPWKTKREIVVTDGEFHTVRRQLLRLQEEGIQIQWVSAFPSDTVGSRLAEKISANTAAVICSSVFFESAQIAGQLELLAEAARHWDTPLLIDTYHQLNVVPFSSQGLESAYVMGGGYKYCQLGEGNCFLRSPVDCELRPVITGWFADFESLEGPQSSRVSYSQSPGARFAGATYDPISHYRGAKVFEFFRHHDLTVERLRATSQRQLRILTEAIDRIPVAPQMLSRDREIPLDRLGGFLALRTPHSALIHQKLEQKGILTDYRGEFLRLGPAPYVSDDQLEQAVATLTTILNSF